MIYFLRDLRQTSYTRRLRDHIRGVAVDGAHAAPLRQFLFAIPKSVPSPLKALGLPVGINLAHLTVRS